MSKLCARVLDTMGGREGVKALTKIAEEVRDYLCEVEHVTSEVEVISSDVSQCVAMVHVDHEFDPDFPRSYRVSLDTYHGSFQACCTPVNVCGVRMVLAGGFNEVCKEAPAAFGEFLVGTYQAGWDKAAETAGGLIDKRGSDNLQFGEWSAQDFADFTSLLGAELSGAGIMIDPSSAVGRRDETDEGHVWSLSFKLQDVPYEFMATIDRKEGSTECQLHATLDKSGYDMLFLQNIQDDGEKVGVPYILGEMRKEVETVKRLAESQNAE